MQPVQVRESGAEPITNSQIGAKLVRLMAEGLLGFCDQISLSYPKTIEEFENTLVSISRKTGFQAGLSFKHRPSHRAFYELLGMDSKHAGQPYDQLFKLAEQGDKSVHRGLVLVFAFATTENPEAREKLLARSADIFRNTGGPDFELIAQAFEKGDCQRDLVFEEMQIILAERAAAANQ